MKTHVVRATDVSGLPVVTIDGGEDVAEIKDVVFDGTNHRLIGFTLNKRGFFSGALRNQLPAAAIEAIGPDAVMVATESDLYEPTDAPDELTGDAPTHSVLHNRVLSADGTDLGEVVGVILTTDDDPIAVGYEVGSDDETVFVPISAQMALSDDNLLIPAEATEFIHNDLAGFGASVAQFRAPLDAAASPSPTPEGA